MSMTGTCEYCGQTRIIKLELPNGRDAADFSEEDIKEMCDREATLKCDCEEARKEREKRDKDTASDETLETLTKPDEFLKDILAAVRDRILEHPELKGASVKVVDPVSIEQRVYKVKADKDGNVIATRTDTTSTADIINR